MKKLFLTAIITGMCMLPAISAENSAPSKYDVGKYNFNFAGEEVTIETKTPAAETVEIQETIEKPVSEIKDIQQKTEETVQSVKTETEKVEKQAAEVKKDTEKALKENLQQTKKEVKKEVNKQKSKAEKEIKYDPDRPPHPFKIVPIQYQGGETKTIERL